MANHKHSKGFVPLSVPLKSSGKLTYKIIQKKDYVRNDGTSALFLQIYLGQRKRIPLNIAVKLSEFSDKKQRVNKSCSYYKDYNLLIEKKLSDINRIEVAYRLQNQYLSLDILLAELDNPTNREDFLIFYAQELEHQKKILKIGTYRQQKSSLTKIKSFKSAIPFYSIDKKLLINLTHYLKTTKKNTDSTINACLKNFKKYLGIANKLKINTPLHYQEIKSKRFKGSRVYLTKIELQNLNKYWQNETVLKSHFNVLARFLFSCFTGLRISDIQVLTIDNIVDHAVVFSSQKTGKFQKIPLSKTATWIIKKSFPFEGDYTDQYINRTLKEICNNCEIRKNVTFHVARHTFATQYLIGNGKVQNLQKVLGHSSINETMIYAHIVDTEITQEINFMDAILKD